MTESAVAPTPLTESTVAPTPLDTLRQRLNEAPSPLLLKDAIKGLTQKGKNAPPPPDFGTILSEEVQAGRVFQYPSGKDGADRYWDRDEKQTIREAVLNAATEPKKLADLKKLAKDMVKADKKFSDAIVDELVSAEQLYKQSSSGNAPYGKEKPRSLDKAAVSAAILAAAETPQNSANLVKEAKKATGADKEFAESIIKELIDGNQLHPQSAATKPLYGKEKSRSLDKAAVGAAILAAVETPQNSANLVKAAKQATGADKEFAESIIKELIDGKQLHPQSTAAKPLYGKNEPPHALDVDPGKKAFTALVKAAQKVLEAASQIPLDEVFHRLRKALEQQPTAPDVEPIAVPVSHPVSVSPPVSPPISSPPS